MILTFIGIPCIFISKKEMETLSNIVTYLLPGLVYILGFITVCNDPFANSFLKGFVFLVMAIHLTAFFYPTAIFACLVILIQSFLLYGSFKQVQAEGKSSLTSFFQFYLFGSIAILISHLVA